MITRELRLPLTTLALVCASPAPALHRSASVILGPLLAAYCGPVAVPDPPFLVNKRRTANGLKRYHDCSPDHTLGNSAHPEGLPRDRRSQDAREALPGDRDVFYARGWSGSASHAHPT